MKYRVVVKKHKKNSGGSFYTVHLLLNGENIRIFGRYRNKSKALAQAKRVAKKYDADV